MNKGNHSKLKDENLREALRQEEAALPQMPADLNDRLMKRLHHERRQCHYRIWPWVVAACVAAVMVVWLPPKENGSEAMTDSGELTAQTCSIATEQGANNDLQKTKDIASTTMAQDQRITNPDTRDRRIANSTERTERITNSDTRDRRIANSTERTERIANPDTHGRRIANSTEQVTEVLLAQEETSDPSKNVTASGEIAPAHLPRAQAKPQQVVLTERDIPISRPENYRYTPEEIALMRRQANETYVKWMELEMAIMKYQLEQIAKQ
ncbi:MAG: hypothetical protein IKH88_12285 [Prevotella sp.]|nr:hypothetical protein [Prevotella sp.]